MAILECCQILNQYQKVGLIISLLTDVLRLLIFNNFQKPEDREVRINYILSKKQNA